MRQYIDGGNCRNVTTPRSINSPEVLASGKARVPLATPGPRFSHKPPGLDGNATPPLGPASLQDAPPAAGAGPCQESVYSLTAALLRLVSSFHLGVCTAESRVRARVTISQPPNPFNRQPAPASTLENRHVLRQRAFPRHPPRKRLLWITC